MAAIAPLRASCVRPVRSRVLARTFHATASACGNKHLDWYFNAIREAEAAKHFVPPPVMPAQTLHGRKRARAYFDFKFGRDNDDPLQRVVFELADDLVPLAVQNFISLCERPSGSGYKGSDLFMVRKGFGILGGDWILNNGRGGSSSFAGGRAFADENFIVRHSAPGVLSMANSGVHSNKSVFFVSVAPLPHLDGRNVAFGRVILGLETIARASTVFAVNLKPANPVTIAACGALPEAEWPAVDKAIADAARGPGAASAAGAKASKQQAKGQPSVPSKAGTPPAAAAAGASAGL